jgi:nucleoside-diphosphate-sugar epimerase
MSVLVTGINGFIGSHLGRRLVAEGREVIAIVRPGSPRERIADYAENVRLIEADLREPHSYRQTLIELRPELAFHLAWYAKPGLFWNAAENLECVSMTLDFARNLATSGCRQLVCAGTCAEYTWQHGHLSEDGTPCEASSLYGVAKNATRKVLESYAPQANLALAWARFFFPFGPGEPSPRLIPSVTQRLLVGEHAPCSHGEQIRDFIYVKDCVAALLAIANAGLTGPVNVGSGEPTRIRTVIEMLSELTGRSLADVEFGALAAPPDEAAMVLADTSRLRAIGWSPSHSLKSGLVETVAWWKEEAGVITESTD